MDENSQREPLIKKGQFEDIEMQKLDVEPKDNPKADKGDITIDTGYSEETSSCLYK